MNDGKHRYQYLIIGLAVAFLLLAAQLFRLQLLDNSFKISAENNALLYQTRHPARGLILDRNGKILVGNKNTYDILVTPRYVKPFDTLELCRILDLDPQYVRDKFSEYRMYRTRIGYRTVTFRIPGCAPHHPHVSLQCRRQPSRLCHRSGPGLPGQTP